MCEQMKLYDTPTQGVYQTEFYHNSAMSGTQHQFFIICNILSNDLAISDQGKIANDCSIP